MMLAFSKGAIDSLAAQRQEAPRPADRLQNTRWLILANSILCRMLPAR